MRFKSGEMEVVVRTHSASIICAAAALIWCGPAFGGILYSNLGPAGNVHSTFTFDGVFGSSTGSGYIALAWIFTPVVSGVDAQIDLGLGYLSGTNSVTVELLTSSKTEFGEVPGTEMESWTANNLPNYGTCCDLVTLHGTSSLTAGMQYWLAVLPGANDTQVAWLINTTGVSTPGAVNGSSVWSPWPPGLTSGAFDIADTTGAPEPATYVLTAGALAIFARLRRR